MIGMLEFHGVRGVLNRPEVHGKSGDHQTETKVEDLNPGYSLLEHHDLHDGVPRRDQSRHERRQYAYTATGKDRYCSEESTPAYTNRQHQCRNSVVAEWCVL